jgi:hypothetical protein
MNRVIGILLTCALTIVPTIVSAQSVTVIVNGQTMQFDQPPVVQAGRVFVPLRGVFQQLGASVVYASGQINATGHGRTISLRIGSTQAVVNGQTETLDVAPFVIGARTLVPLRFVAQALGAYVSWNDSNSTVTITSGRGAPPPPAPAPPPRPGIVFTLRAPTGTINNRHPQIRFQVNRPIQLGQFRVRFDGGNVTPAVQSNGQYFYFPVPGPLPQGTHTVRVFGNTVGGAPFDLSWSFNQAAP